MKYNEKMKFILCYNYYMVNRSSGQTFKKYCPQRMEKVLRRIFKFDNEEFSAIWT